MEYGSGPQPPYISASAQGNQMLYSELKSEPMTPEQHVAQSWANIEAI